MKIINKPLLASMAHPGPCEWCGKLCSARESHHIFSRGAGRLDIRINLIALGKGFSCPCHTEAHQGHITKDDFLAVVAVREKCYQADIRDVVHLLRRMQKEWDGDRLEAEMMDFTVTAKRLFARTLGLEKA